MMRRLATMLTAAALLAPAALAQISGEGGPIRVNAGSSEVSERLRQVVLIDEVDIMQGDARLRANRVTISYASSGDAEATGMSGFGDIRSMVAEGEVFYVTPELKATGTQGVYDAAADTITLTGDVVLVRGEDVATGSRLVMRLEEGRTTLDGGDGRVQFNISPNSAEASENDQADDTADGADEEASN